MSQQPLQIMGSSPLSLIFLSVYTMVLLCQFTSLIIHRLGTLLHFIARAPFTPGRLKSNWSWYDEDLQAQPKPEQIENARREFQRKMSTRKKSTDPQKEKGYGPLKDGDHELWASPHRLGIDNAGFSGETA